MLATGAPPRTFTIRTFDASKRQQQPYKHTYTQVRTSWSGVLTCIHRLVARIASLARTLVDRFQRESAKLPTKSTQCLIDSPAAGTTRERPSLANWVRMASAPALGPSRRTRLVANLRFFSSSRPSLSPGIGERRRRNGQQHHDTYGLELLQRRHAQQQRSVRNRAGSNYDAAVLEDPERGGCCQPRKRARKRYREIWTQRNG